MRKPYEIYCDYDGVLVDFERGAYSVFGHHFGDPYYDSPQKKEERNKKIMQHPHFWENLFPMRDYDQLWNFIKNFHPNILTAYAQWDPEGSKHGKTLWNHKHTKVSPDHMHIVSRDNKQKYARDAHGNPNVLIDDFPKNIHEWEAKGGIGILHTSAVTTIHKLMALGFAT